MDYYAKYKLYKKKYLKLKAVMSGGGNNIDYSSYAQLSPFELKNILIKMAKEKGEDTILNAGRGNPNFFNYFVRNCFTHLQHACLHLSKKVPGAIDLNLYPPENSSNFKEELINELSKDTQITDKIKNFLIDFFNYLEEKAINQNIDPNHIIHSIILSSLGCFYPSPPQRQPFIPLIAKKFMYKLVFGTKETTEKPENYEFNPTEGAAAGILYVFNTLHINDLLSSGDTIAIITPIFSPYLEMPKLAAYDINIVELKCNPNNNYSLDDTEINKLKDKTIKALFMVNPANPGEYSLPLNNIRDIGKIVNTERQDLIIVSDNVYAPFVDEYNSLMYSCPKNTIEIFSLSKYFGVTGWRLGLIMIRKNNNFNTLLAQLPESKKLELRKRYSIASMKPDELTLMERIVLDSRQVAEAHVGGLSTPQQLIMAMFLYYDLHDVSRIYNKEVKKLLKQRMLNLYSHLDTEPDFTDTATDYYTLLPILKITEKLFGVDALNKLEKINYLQFLFNLSKKYQVVLLPGSGFGTGSPWYIRVSLANLQTDDYSKISLAVKNCINDFI